MMDSTLAFDVIYTHTEGEPTCIVHSGITYPADSTILEKRQFLETNYDWLRLALMREPRGHRDMFGVFLTPPSAPGFDGGLIWIDGSHYSHMCGHGTIAVCMAYLALGFKGKPPAGGVVPLRFETTAGPIACEVGVEASKVLWTKFENVPAYVHAKAVPLELPGFGTTEADLVWGGNYFGIIDWRGKNLKISPENSGRLAQIGVIAREMLREKVQIRHPLHDHITNLNFITLWHEPTIPAARYKNVHVFSGGQCDRSPGGTGTSAMMAMFEARGQLKLHEPILSEGLLGTGTFEGCLVGETALGSVRAVRPTVKGTASILGTARWIIDPADKVGAGFLVG